MAVDLSEQVVLRWDSESNCAAFLETGGIDAVWLQTAGDSVAGACRAAGADVLPPGAIRLLPLADAGRAGTESSVAVKAGVWPGAQAASRGSGGAFVAGATGRAWVDANGYLVPYLRALYPALPPVLGYLPDRDAGITKGRVISYESLELALVEAWCAGGNYILAPDAAYRDALLANNETAISAWKWMGRTARWLKQQRSLFRGPTPSTITVLVEPGDTTAEIASLMYRHSGSPDLVSASRPPAPDPLRRAIVVAAGIQSITPALGKNLLGHAKSGAVVVTDAAGPQAWWRVPGLKPARAFEDREFYNLGAGRLVVYRQVIVDPGDFALDVLDLAADRRPVRMWDMSSAIAAVSSADSRSATLKVVNYGSPARSEIMVHVHGLYGSATLSRPEGDPLSLRVYRRRESTEVMLPGLSRVAVVRFA